MPRIAVITGASSGLGAVYARTLDKSEKFDELWLIARREERLVELASTLRHATKILALDLTKSASFDRYEFALATKAKPSPFERLEKSVEKSARSVVGKSGAKRGGANAESGLQIVYLVNCAGSGKIGNYDDIAPEENDAMINLNCRAAVQMTLASLPYMRRGSKIVNVASTAAFQPFQHLALYAATKSFLLSWSRALRWELFSRGIHVTALCPYWMTKTEFIKNAESGAMWTHGIRNFWFGDNAQIAVRLSLVAAALNLPFVTGGIVSGIHSLLAKFVPHEIMQALWELWRLI